MDVVKEIAVNVNINSKNFSGRFFRVSFFVSLFFRFKQFSFPEDLIPIAFDCVKRYNLK